MKESKIEIIMFDNIFQREYNIFSTYIFIFYHIIIQNVYEASENKQNEIFISVIKNFSGYYTGFIPN